MHSTHGHGVITGGAWVAALLMALIATLGGGPAFGAARVQFTVAEIAGDGWRAAGVTIALHRDASGRLAAHVTAAQLELPAPIGTLEQPQGECHDLLITTQRVVCRAVSLAPGAGLPFIPPLEGRLTLQRHTGALDWQLATAADRAQALRFDGVLADDSWRMRLALSGWPVAEFAPLAARFDQAVPTMDGQITVSLTASGAADHLQGLVFEIEGTNLSFANDSGTIAAEGIGFQLSGSAWPGRDGITFDARGAADAGEAYVEPVYANLAAHPLQLTVRGNTTGEGLAIDQLVVAQDGVLRADAQADIRLSAENGWGIPNGRLRIAEATLPGAYETLLQPFLAGGVLGNLETSGLLRGELDVRDNELAALHLEFMELNLDDRNARLAIYDLSGELAWTPGDGATTPAPQAARLRWSGGFMYGLPFGAARVLFDRRGEDWSLARPVAIPLLDGALEIDVLEIGNLVAGDDSLLFEARLTPLSMRELSRALDWPPLSGTLSGVLPSLSYVDGLLIVAGELSAEVFSGEVAVRNLRIERLLQPRARLQADVELRGMDLAEVTGALAFGLMTGRLDGYVRGLEMIDWAPVAFDARLYTPPGDRTRQRISQRAVDNIASIGAGGAGALSTGFLRFFESFSYEAFALGCRLERDTCRMSGLETRDDGYVILRGRGLPRIDVKGFATEVSWPTLIEQLASIMESEGPEVR